MADRPLDSTDIGSVLDAGWEAGWKKFGDWATQVGEDLNFIPKKVDPNAPGASIDVGTANQDRQRMQGLLAQLQQQAATGSGSWEGALESATQQNMGNAQAIGQSGSGSYGSSLRAIGNGQAAAQQRGIGQGNILRAQSQQGAQDQLAGLYANIGGTDAAQSAAVAATAQGVRSLDNALKDSARKTATNAVAGMGGMASSLMSDGGKVPGRAPVFGDDEVNDIVPAKLSPGEIVIPRTIAHDPEAAADFVRAVNAKNGRPSGPNFADGGQTGLKSSGSAADYGSAENVAKTIFAPHVGVGGAYRNNQEAPSIQNGGLLDTANYDANRMAQLQNSELIAQRAAGQGPSVAPQLLQNASDAAVQAAMTGGAGMPVGNLVSGSVAGQSGAGGEAVVQAAREQESGQKSFGNTMTNLRAQDLALAQAKQQAAFRNTQLNAGIDLAQMTQLQNIFAGAGQAAAAASRFKGKDEPGRSAFTSDMAGNRGGPADLGNLGQFDSDPPPPNPSDVGEWDTGGFAMGGVIPGYADGGQVAATQRLLAAINKAHQTKEPARPQPVIPGDSAPYENSYAPQTVAFVDPSSGWLSKASVEAGPASVGPVNDVMRPTPSAVADPNAPSYADQVAMWDARQRLNAMGPAQSPPGAREANNMARLRAILGADFAREMPKASPQPQNMADGGGVEMPPEMPRFQMAPIDEAQRSRDLFNLYSMTGGFPAQQGAGMPSGAGVAGVPPQGVTDAMAQAWAEGTKPETLKRAAIDGIKQISRPIAGPFVSLGEQVVDNLGAQAARPPLPAGVSKPGTIPAPSDEAGPPPVVPPPVIQRPVSSGVRIPGIEDRSAIDKQLQDATLQTAELDAQKVHAEQQGLLAKQNFAQAKAAEEQQLQERINMRVNSAMTNWQAKQDEFNRIDTKVDPNRFWATRTTGQKVAGIIGLALGTIGAGNDGVNKAAVMLNNAVDKDLELQKDEYEARLKKGARAVEGAQSFYAQARQSGFDEVSAFKLAKAAGLDAIAARTEATIAGINEPIARQRGQMLVAAQKNAAAEQRQQGAHQYFTEAATSEQLRQGNEHLAIQRATAAAAATKSTLSPERLKIADDVNTASGNILRNALELKKSIDTYGTQEKYTPGVEEGMSRRSTEIATEMAKMLDPATGVRDPEMARWSELIFKPGFFQREENAQAILDDLIKSVTERRAAALRVRGITP